MVKISISISIGFCVLAIFAFAGVNSAKTQQNAPAPAVDCSTIIFSMADCLTFVTSGSKVTKPEGGCCSGLKTVLKTDAECLCETFKNSGSLGIVLNVTKAMTLPSACGVSAPSISKCGLPGDIVAPGAAPVAHSPKSSSPSPKSSKSVATAPTPAAEGNSTAVSQLAAPAPSPSSSDASPFSISFVPLFVSLVAAWCSFI